MAKDAGVDDAWAKYGQSQNTPAYQLLREVTHWSDEDVEREKRISQRSIKPSRELAGFNDLFEYFRFGSGQAYYELSTKAELTTEQRNTIVGIWKTVVDVQQHFNDISMRIRGLFITLILALSAAIGFLAEKDLKLDISNVTIHYAVFVPLGGIVGTLLFYFIDRYWYHRLLIGSVNQGAFIEDKHRFDIPEIRLSQEIGAASPIELTRPITKLLARIIVRDKAYKEDKRIHSTAKIELFYKPIVYIFFGVFVIMTIAGGLLINKSSLIDVAIKKYHSRTINSSPSSGPAANGPPQPQKPAQQPPNGQPQSNATTK